MENFSNKTEEIQPRNSSTPVRNQASRNSTSNQSLDNFSEETEEIQPQVCSTPVRDQASRKSTSNNQTFETSYSESDTSTAHTSRDAKKEQKKLNQKWKLLYNYGSALLIYMETAPLLCKTNNVWTWKYIQRNVDFVKVVRSTRDMLAHAIFTHSEAKVDIIANNMEQLYETVNVRLRENREKWRENFKEVKKNANGDKTVDYFKKCAEFDQDWETQLAQISCASILPKSNKGTTSQDDLTRAMQNTSLKDTDVTTSQWPYGHAFDDSASPQQVLKTLHDFFGYIVYNLVGTKDTKWERSASKVHKNFPRT